MLLFILFAISFAQVNFVAVGDDTTSGNLNSIKYSVDGLTWTPVVDRIFSVQGASVVYSDFQKKWMAVGQGTTNTMAWSSDGISWNGLGTIALTIAGNDIAYSEFQNRWVAVGQSTSPIVYSVDGLNWNTATPVIFDIAGNGVEYSPSLNRWVAVGWSVNKIAWSSDGANWNALGNIVFSDRGLSVAFGGGKWVITGMTLQTQAWSADGISWTVTPELISNTRQDAAFGQGKWILVGPSPTTFQDSLDALSWISQPSVSGLTNVYGITFSSYLNRWVAVGSSSAVSLDGSSWTVGQVPFSTQGWKVASFFSTQSSITANVNNLVIGTAVVPIGVIIEVSGNLTVTGNLTISGDWTIGSSATINVNNILSISGSTGLNISSGMSTPLNVNSLEITSGAQLNIKLLTPVAVGASVTYLIANFSQRVGSFVLSGVGLRRRTECLSAYQTYTSSTLSVTISNQPCNGILLPITTTSGQPASDNTTLIVGVAVGCSVLGVAIAIVVILLTRCKMIKWQTEANQRLKTEHMAGMKPSPGVNL